MLTNPVLVVLAATPLVIGLVAQGSSVTAVTCCDTGQLPASLSANDRDDP